jgi:hypothetical protein
MTIGIVGGVERDRIKYLRLAESHGHGLEYHHGHTGGRGTEVLRAMVARCDLVVIITDIASHGGVKVAREAAQLAGRRVMLTRRCSASGFVRLLEQQGGAP